MQEVNQIFNGDETHASFEYLKNNTEEFYGISPNIFDSNLKIFFDYIASEEKENIDYSLLSTQISTPSKKTLSFLKEYGDL